ncbi:uncharacterized protein [Ptychodera flava]|uniref:uncharacterized protein n=1 Tax=Ptychodera flava TaxID=63121 RepID=UPI00396A0867
MAYARKQGIMCSSYIDDIFNKAAKIDLCHKNTTTLMTLLRQLGFIPNEQKSHLLPTKQLVHLGRLYNTTEMSVMVPPQKLQRISATALSIKTKQYVSLRQVAHILGLIEDARAAMTIAASHYRGLQQQLTHNLAHHSWDYHIQLNQASEEDLSWWIHKAANFNGRPIQTVSPDMVIQSDASLVGWGAVCANKTVQGRWTQQEKSHHINVLEILAAKLAIQSFLQDKSKMEVKLQMDNTTAVAYLKHQGGSRSQSLCKVALQIWQFCEQRSINLTVEHLPGRNHTSLTVKSKIKHTNSPGFLDCHDYQLDTKIFQRICDHFYQPEIDLFASRITKQLPQFVSWKRSPQAFAVNAFTLRWTGKSIYMFPPPPLISRCLQKLRIDQARAIVITPVWPQSPWYPLLLQMSCQKPLLLPRHKNLLIEPHTGKPPRINLMPLAAWLLSGNTTETWEFQKQQQKYYSKLSAEGHLSNMTSSGENMLAGVINRKQIQFLVLSQ